MAAKRRGSAVLEAALAFPLLFLILLGAMDFSRVFFTAVEVANAAEAGVRYGAQNATKAADLAGIETAAVNDTDITGITATASEVCQCEDGTSVTCSGSCGSQGKPLIYAKVTTTASYSTIVPWPTIPSPIQINGKAEMRVQ